MQSGTASALSRSWTSKSSVGPMNSRVRCESRKNAFDSRTGRPMRQEFDELVVIERAEADADVPLDVPDALADHHVFAQPAMAGVAAELRLVVRLQSQPLTLKLPHLDRHLEIIGEHRGQPGRGARAAGQETRVMEDRRVLDPGECVLVMARSGRMAPGQSPPLRTSEKGTVPCPHRPRQPEFDFAGSPFPGRRGSRGNA